MIILLLNFFLLFTTQSSGQVREFQEHEKENESQFEFPGLKIKSSGADLGATYAIKLGTNKFQEVEKLKAGDELMISSYVIAEEIFNSSNINSLSYKTTKEEIVKIFNSNDSKKIAAFITTLAGKNRTYDSDEELLELEKLIEKKETGDHAPTTTYFKTGMIEVLPVSGSGEVRHFIPFEKIKDFEINAQESKIKVLKSLSLLGFKEAKQNINYGFLSEEEMTIITENENKLRDECLGECPLQEQFKIGDLVNDVINITAFNFFAEPGFDFLALNQAAILQQACLMQIVNEVCPSTHLQTSIEKLIQVESLQNFLKNGDIDFKDYCSKLATTP
jgi:hypothetical protein